MPKRRAILQSAPFATAALMAGPGVFKDFLDRSRARVDDDAAGGHGFEHRPGQHKGIGQIDVRRSIFAGRASSRCRESGRESGPG